MMPVPGQGYNGMSRFLFSDTNADGTTSLYSTDGTAAGTNEVNLPGFQSIGGEFGSTPDFTAFDNKLFFIANGDYGDAYRPLIYSTDGTATGSSGAVLSSSGGYEQPLELLVLNGKLLATGEPNGLSASSDGVTFTELEDSVGTDNLAVSNGVGFFGGTENAQGENPGGLWRTDGTAAGTVNITPPGVTLHPVNFTPVANGVTLFFNQLSSGYGQLWATSGTAASTHQVVNTPIPDTIIVGPGSASTGTRSVFSAIDAAGNISAWATDGTAAGTEEIRVNGPADAAVRTPYGFTSFGNKVVFDSGYGLVVTDGTKAGTVTISDLESVSFRIAGGKIFFIQPPGMNGSPLFVSDGTVAGTTQVSVSGLQSSESALDVDGNQVVFSGLDTSGKEALFTSDGTTAGSGEVNLPANVSISSSATIYAAGLPSAAPGIVTLPGGAQSYSAAAGVTVQAGSGDDTITASAGLVTVLGSSGQLVFFGGTGASSVSGSAGSATIFGGTGGGQFSGGAAGHNILVSQGAAGGNTTLTGAAAGDELFGSAAGNDVLVLGAGRELALGGGGNTTVEGGTGSSVIFTEGGPTTVFGGSAGADTVVGGTGALTVTAEKGDAIFGGTGALAVTGSTSGADSIIGGAGALSVVGHGGNMLVAGSTSTSNIYTGNGASLIFAESGAVGVTGGSGPMQVVLGSGSGTFIEGNGSALYDFVNGSGGGSYVITNFRPGTDTIDLYGYTPAQQAISIGPASTVLSLSDGSKIQLLGVTNPGHSIIG